MSEDALRSLDSGPRRTDSEEIELRHDRYLMYYQAMSLALHGQ